MATDNTKIQIISEDGTIYNFGTSLENEEAFETTTSINNNPTVGPLHCVTAWYLTEIISADHSDTIFFKYNTSSIGYGSSFQQALYYYYDFGIGSSNHYQGEIDEVGDIDGHGLSVSNSRKLSEIIFANGKVVFNSSIDREDLDGGRTLNSIEVFSNDNLSTPIKRFNLETSYFNANVNGTWETSLEAHKKKRLRLDNFNEVGKPAYTFGYNTTALPPINSFRQDHQ